MVGKAFLKNKTFISHGYASSHSSGGLVCEGLRHILRPILVIFEICHFLMIPGLFEYFSENECSQNIKLFSMKEQSLPPFQFSFRRVDLYTKS